MKTNNQIKYHFASKIEGQKLISEHNDYYLSMSQIDIEWRLKKKGGTIEELKELGQKCILEFTEKEKEYINNSIKFIEETSNSFGFELPFPEQGIIFIKTSMLEEGGASGYTHKNEIYLGENDFPKMYFLMNEELKKKVLSKFNGLISHEIFHCLTRNSPKFRKHMYSLIGFNILDKDIDFPPEIKKIIVKNPDVDHMDNYGEFTIEGVKRKCELIIIFTKTYPEVEAEGRKNDLFFFYILPVLIPIDTLDTYYPCNMVPDFLEKVGENTSYLIAPEEILADNFKEIVTKSDINSFPNPELLKNMIKALQEWNL